MQIINLPMNVFKLSQFCLILCLLQNVVNAQYKLDNYKITFSKINQSDAALDVTCKFDLILDSVTQNSKYLDVNFGGQLKKYAIDNLKIKSNDKITYKYKSKEKKIIFKFKKNNKDTVRIQMSYSYLSLSVAWIYKGVAEFWETSYNEYYYPYVFGQKVNFDVTINVPDTCIIVGNHLLYNISNENGIKKYHFITQSPVISHSLVFGILPYNSYIYEKDTLKGFPIDMYLLKSITVPNERIEELKNLTVASINYFSEKITPYTSDNSRNELTYIFHKNEFSNRNNGNFIIASQQKFATKPHLIPLVHEIGHRWFGEWTLLIKDGAPAAYFIKESLNEYFSLMFVKHYYGRSYFDSLFNEEYIIPYNKIKNTKKDTSLYSMEYNNNNTVVYRKGAIIINDIVEKIGEDKWLRFMKEFYLKYNEMPNLSYSDFISLFSKYDKNMSLYLDELIKCNSNVLDSMCTTPNRILRQNQIK